MWPCAPWPSARTVPSNATRRNRLTSIGAGLAPAGFVIFTFAKVVVAVVGAAGTGVIAGTRSSGTDWPAQTPGFPPPGDYAVTAVGCDFGAATAAASDGSAASALARLGELVAQSSACSAVRANNVGSAPDPDAAVCGCIGQLSYAEAHDPSVRCMLPAASTTSSVASIWVQCQAKTFCEGYSNVCRAPGRAPAYQTAGGCGAAGWSAAGIADGIWLSNAGTVASNTMTCRLAQLLRAEATLAAGTIDFLRELQIEHSCAAAAEDGGDVCIDAACIPDTEGCGRYADDVLVVDADTVEGKVGKKDKHKGKGKSDDEHPHQLSPDEADRDRDTDRTGGARKAGKKGKVKKDINKRKDEPGEKKSKKEKGSKQMSSKKKTKEEPGDGREAEDSTQDNDEATSNADVQGVQFSTQGNDQATRNPDVQGVDPAPKQKKDGPGANKANANARGADPAPKQKGGAPKTNRLLVRTGSVQSSSGSATDFELSLLAVHRRPLLVSVLLAASVASILVVTAVFRRPADPQESVVERLFKGTGDPTLSVEICDENELAYSLPGSAFADLPLHSPARIGVHLDASGSPPGDALSPRSPLRPRVRAPLPSHLLEKKLLSPPMPGAEAAPGTGTETVSTGTTSWWPRLYYGSLPVVLWHSPASPTEQHLDALAASDSDLKSEWEDYSSGKGFESEHEFLYSLPREEPGRGCQKPSSSPSTGHDSVRQVPPRHFEVSHPDDTASEFDSDSTAFTSEEAPAATNHSTCVESG